MFMSLYSATASLSATLVGEGADLSEPSVGTGVDGSDGSIAGPNCAEPKT